MSFQLEVSTGKSTLYQFLTFYQELLVKSESRHKEVLQYDSAEGQTNNLPNSQSHSGNHNPILDSLNTTAQNFNEVHGKLMKLSTNNIIDTYVWLYDTLDGCT